MHVSGLETAKRHKIHRPSQWQVNSNHRDRSHVWSLFTLAALGSRRISSSPRDQTHINPTSAIASKATHRSSASATSLNNSFSTTKRAFSSWPLIKSADLSTYFNDFNAKSLTPVVNA
uniref:Uncharacterized protein n=1 Tax=Panagrellus redivivus TaxID=6233 RepID=A0A7E4W8I7_PANRE